MSANKLIPHPAPKNQPYAPQCHQGMVVTANGQPLDVYRTWINAQNSYTPGQTRVAAGVASFDSDGPVKIEVKLIGNALKSCTLYPSRLGIETRCEAGTLTFTIDPSDRPKQIVLKLNDSCHSCLHLFGNPLETDVSKEGDPNMRYFGPGVHCPADDGIPGQINIASGQTICLAAGAVVRGFIQKADAEDIKDVTFRGRGILNHHIPGDTWTDGYRNEFKYLGATHEETWSTACGRHNRDKVKMRRVQNLKIEGTTLLNHWDCQNVQFGFMIYWCDDVVIENVKYIGHNRCSEGPNIGSCENVLVKNSFFRAFDDVVCIKGFVDAPSGGWVPSADVEPAIWSKPTRNVRYEDCILVRDKMAWEGSAINLAWQSYTPEISDCGFRNIDILRPGGHTIRIEPEWIVGEGVVFKNLLFEDIRVEEAPDTRILAVRALERDHKGSFEGWPPRVENVRFVRYTSPKPLKGDRPIWLEGDIKDLTFEDSRLEGAPWKTRLSSSHLAKSAVPTQVSAFLLHIHGTRQPQFTQALFSAAP